ncbi:MAG: hypothetical protein HQ596_07365, partial [Candidatus Saganbacteria bacterium]|nr:hypothetical protein [Candidatus Saganbacteria bacterium]
MHKFKLFIFVLLSLLLVVVFSTTALANTPPDIRPVNDPFGFTLPSADEGDTAYSAYFSALDPDGDPVTFSVVSKPSWLAFQDLGKNDAVLGLVFGQEIPEVIGQGPDYYYIDISAYDGVNPAVVETFCLPVVNIDQSPVADAGPDRSVYEGESVVLANDSYDVDGDILGYTWRAPAPITLNDVHVTNPTFTAPQVNADTDYEIILQVEDVVHNIIVADTVTITVVIVNQPPAWSSCNIALTEDSDPQVIDLNGYCNDPDGDSISYSPASGGDQATVAWSISGS